MLHISGTCDARQHVIFMCAIKPVYTMTTNNTHILITCSNNTNINTKITFTVLLDTRVNGHHE